MNLRNCFGGVCYVPDAVPDTQPTASKH